MKNVLSVFASVVALTVSGCATKPFTTNDQSVADNMAENLGIQYEVVTTHGAAAGLPCQTLHAEWASCDQINMTLTNNGSAITSKDWKIYFHSIRMILDVQNAQFKVTHITGDLHTLEPTDSFTGLAAGESAVIPYIGEYWTLFEGDYMPRSYVIAGSSEPRTIKSTDKENPSAYTRPISGDNWKRTPDDNNILATAQTRFEKNSAIPLIADDTLSTKIIPTPLRTEVSSATVSLAKGVTLENKALSAEMLRAVTDRLALLGVQSNGDYPVHVSVSPSLFSGKRKVEGAYQLEIDKEQCTVVGYDKTGAFYGLQSLLSLMNVGENREIPTMKVLDAPRFSYRGFMLDVARNFHSKDVVLKTLDQMAAYKLNKLHFHLTDDEGWRLEIPGLPELTEIGGKRCHDESETECLLPQLGSGPTSENFGSGFYSKQDYKEILRYAKARGIEVIPEIDMPAHARAAVVSMEARHRHFSAKGDMKAASEFRLIDPEDSSNVTTVQFYDKRSFINPCMDSSITFVDKVISEVAAMHKEAGMPLSTWHFGGDEAKNIKLGDGFQDNNAKEKVEWKGDLDLSNQDKPFEKSPICQQAIAAGMAPDYDHLPSYFAEQVSKISAKYHVTNFQAWQDGLKYSKNSKAFATENVRVNFWDILYWGGGASAYEWPAKGYDLIVSNPDYVYLDMPYEVDPKEPGYYWATRATDTRKIFTFAPDNLPQNAETSVDRDGNGFTSEGTVKNSGLFGMSAQLWSESVRTDEALEYMVFPRILAVAERAWHKADWELEYKPGVEYSQETNKVNKSALQSDWSSFANILGQRELMKLDAAGIQYRVPIPGARIVNGHLEMNVSLPGLMLSYSTDSGKNWQEYNPKTTPAVAGTVSVRSASSDGKRFSRIISLNNKE